MSFFLFFWKGVKHQLSSSSSSSSSAWCSSSESVSPLSLLITHCTFCPCKVLGPIWVHPGALHTGHNSVSHVPLNSISASVDLCLFSPCFWVLPCMYFEICKFSLVSGDFDNKRTSIQKVVHHCYVRTIASRSGESSVTRWLKRLMEHVRGCFIGKFRQRTQNLPGAFQITFLNKTLIQNL